MKPKKFTLFLCVIVAVFSGCDGNTISKPEHDPISSSSNEVLYSESQNDLLIETLDIEDLTKVVYEAGLYVIDPESNSSPDFIFRPDFTSSMNTFHVQPDGCAIGYIVSGKGVYLYDCTTDELFYHSFITNSFGSYIGDGSIALLPFGFYNEEQYELGEEILKSYEKDVWIETNFMKSLEESIRSDLPGDIISATLYDLYYDDASSRYYAAHIVRVNDIPHYAAALYDDETNLLSYVFVEEGVAYYERKYTHTLTPRILAVDDYKMYTNVSIDFNFDDKSYIYYVLEEISSQYDDYAGQYAYTPGSYEQEPTLNSQGDGLIAKDNSLYVVTYLDNVPQLVNRTTAASSDNSDVQLVRTDRGEIELFGNDNNNLYSNSCAWAPQGGYYFTGLCGEYQWDVAEKLQDFYGVDTFTHGVFRMLPDDSIEFICPLTRQNVQKMRFVGEDIQGRYYIYLYN